MNNKPLPRSPDLYLHDQEQPSRLARRLRWRRIAGDAPGYHPPVLAITQTTRDWWRWFSSLDAPETTGQITFF